MSRICKAGEGGGKTAKCGSARARKARKKTTAHGIRKVSRRRKAKISLSA